jgi:hypothetical protein
MRSWDRRLHGWLDAGSQWLDHRRRDVAWIHRRGEFEAELPRLRENCTWVFIVGCNNSGTTLIHDLLAATGQFSFMPHEGQRYTQVLRRAQKKGHERVWSEYLAELRLDESAPMQGVPRLWFDWLAAASRPLQDRILEKTTANAVRMKWLQRAFPQSAFVGVVRNPYAVAEGIKRKGGKNVARGARHWRCVNEIMLSDASDVRRFLLVRYEDFVAAPQQVTQHVESLLGESGTGSGASTAPATAREIRDMNAASIDRLSLDEIRVVTAEVAGLLPRIGYAPLQTGSMGR